MMVYNIRPDIVKGQVMAEPSLQEREHDSVQSIEGQVMIPKYDEVPDIAFQLNRMALQIQHGKRMKNISYYFAEDFCKAGRIFNLMAVIES